MSTDQLPAERPNLTPAQRFRGLVEGVAKRDLERLTNSETFREAALRVPLALTAAANSAKDPRALFAMAETNPASVGACVALSALTGIMPGGAYPGCYLVPMDGALQWWLNHRGIIVLARRAGLNVEAIPHYAGDTWEYERGLEPKMRHVPGTGPKTTETLVGVGVIVRNLANRSLIDLIDVGADIIRQRRAKSRGSVWQQWPEEMAIKTAIKYAAARGIVTLDDIGAAALAGDAESVEAEPEAPPTRARIIVPETTRALPAPSLDDFTEPTAEERAEIERAERGGK